MTDNKENKDTVMDTKFDDVIDDVKETAKGVTEKVKKTAKKAAATTKNTAKNVKKTISREDHIFFQVFGNEYDQKAIVEKVEEAYKAEGHRVSSIKELSLYIKPEENTAYYVINGKTEGKVTLF